MTPEAVAQRLISLLIIAAPAAVAKLAAGHIRRGPPRG